MDWATCSLSFEELELVSDLTNFQDSKTYYKKNISNETKEQETVLSSSIKKESNFSDNFDILSVNQTSFDELLDTRF